MPCGKSKIDISIKIDISLKEISSDMTMKLEKVIIDISITKKNLAISLQKIHLTSGYS
jgi:hypothetical protein